MTNAAKKIKRLKFSRAQKVLLNKILRCDFASENKIRRNIFFKFNFAKIFNETSSYLIYILLNLKLNYKNFARGLMLKSKANTRAILNLNL